MILQNNILVAHVKLPDSPNTTNKKLVGSILPKSTAVSVFIGRRRLKTTEPEVMSGRDSEGHNHKKKAG